MSRRVTIPKGCLGVFPGLAPISPEPGGWPPTQPGEDASVAPTRGCPQCGRTDWCEPGCSFNVDEMAR